MNVVEIYIIFYEWYYLFDAELLSECTMMMFGVPVGYSSPNTMTDMSTKVGSKLYICMREQISGVYKVG